MALRIAAGLQTVGTLHLDVVIEDPSEGRVDIADAFILIGLALSVDPGL